MYREYSIRADKERFEKAKASIDALYADIVANVGEPNTSERNQSCGRTNQKNDAGRLSCGVMMYFAYTATDHIQASELATKIHQTLDVRIDLADITYTDMNSKLPYSKLIDKQYQIASTKYQDKKTKIKCFLSTTYAISDSAFHVITTSAPHSMSVQLGCSDKAKTEHYPLNS